jgi:hypothetical protein
MKKILILASLVFALVTLSCQSIVLIEKTAPQNPQVDPSQLKNSERLSRSESTQPSGVNLDIVPQAPIQPASNQQTPTQQDPRRQTAFEDPLLLQGWTFLNQQTEPVRLANGRTLSGHELAQFVLQNGIPIVWDTGNVCHGSSCSMRYCLDEICTHTSANPLDTQAIYISLSNRGKVNDLLDTLAHEIYHYMEPFGPVYPTLYEEYTAYEIGARISGIIWANFEVDGLQPACLTQWFDDNHLLEGYQNLKAYPAVLLSSVEPSSPTCRTGQVTR